MADQGNLRLEWRDASELADNPHNWRKHPAKQLDALKDVIEEVGWAGVVLYNESTNRLIDGHARKEVAGDQKVPVLIGSWTEEQEKKILVTLDPLAALAEIDEKKISELISSVRVESDSLVSLLRELKENVGVFDVDEVGFPSVSEGDRSEFQQMTFTLHDSQVEVVKEAIDKAKKMGFFEGPNENSNGNALARIAEMFNGQG